jgi:hypothetical protein
MLIGSRCKGSGPAQNEASCLLHFSIERMAMSDNPGSNEERPCLHCLIADTIDDFYAEYGSLSGEKDTIDMDEIISALGKTVAELTFGSDPAVRQRIVEDLMSEISRFEAEYASAPGSDMRH